MRRGTARRLQGLLDRHIARPSARTSDIVAAIDAAVSDGVDVINFSIGGDG